MSYCNLRGSCYTVSMNTNRTASTSTTESIFGFTPEEARDFENTPHTFKNTEEELLNFFPSSKEDAAETYNKYVEECHCKICEG